ncbi:MAG: transposase [Chlorobi bacterium]|nr:transposase [Chlorobiota bacterium]
MIITKAYRTEIYPTDEQAIAFRKTCAAVRFVYNWALCRKIEAYRDEEANPELVKELGAKVRELKKTLKLITPDEDGGFVHKKTGEVLTTESVEELRQSLQETQQAMQGLKPKYLGQSDLQGQELAALKEKEPWLKEVPGMALLAALQNNDRAFKRFGDMVKKEGARPRGKRLTRQPGFLYRWFGAEMVESGQIEYPNLEYYPRFQTTRDGLGGFKFFSAIRVKRREIRVRGIEGYIKLAEADAMPLPPQDAAWIDGKGKNAGMWKQDGSFEYLSQTREDKSEGRLPIGQRRFASGAITEDRGRWYVSLTFTEAVPDLPPPDGVDVLAVHLGLQRLATFSDGSHVPRPAHYEENEKRLARLNRSLARGREEAKKVGRRWKQSNDYRERRKEKGDLEAHIANQRKAFSHELTARITSQRPKILVLHDWGIQGMMRDDGKRVVKKKKSNGEEVEYSYRVNLAKPISHAAWGMLNNQIKYKAQWQGIEVVIAPSEFAVTQRCSACGELNQEMGKPNPPVMFQCPCGNKMHRDDNAAKNLWWYGHQYLAQTTPNE